MDTVIITLPTCEGCARVPDYTCDLEISDDTPRHLLLITQVPAPDTLLPIGVHQLTFTITDPSGNRTICTRSLLVTCASQTVYLNTELTVECPEGQAGDPVTIPAGQYSSLISQADANAQALAAAEAALVCCSDTAALIAGNLNSAVYDPVRDVIWGTGTPGHILKFNSDTGELISNTFVFSPDWGNDGNIAYCPETDRLYSCTRISYSSTGFTADFKLYEIHPDTLAITNSVNLNLIDSTWATNGGGILRLYAFNGNLVGISIDASQNPNFFVINPVTVFPAAPGGSFAQTSLASIGIFGDVAFENRIDPVAATVHNENSASSYNYRRFAAAITTAGGGYKSLIAVAPPAYGLTYSEWSRTFYVATGSQLVRTTNLVCDAIGSINLGRPSAVPYNIRANPYTYYIYVPTWPDNAVVIIDPQNDSVVATVTGFDSPYDVVFTPTKAFAIQHSRQGLKEIVASLTTIPAPTPDPPDPVMVKQLLSYYDFEEASPGPWLDLKGSNDLKPGGCRANNGTSPGTISAFDIQADDKILIGGNFTHVNGTARSRLARLNPTGTVGLDAAFVPVTVPLLVFAIAVQADTKIIVGGATSNRLVRMDATGVNEGGFAPAPNGTITDLAIQSGDQKILVAGLFSSIAGRTIRGITRLKTDGTDDTTWNTSAGGVVNNTLLTPGTGYVTANGVATTGGTGTGATFDIVDDGGGGVASATLVNPGTGYTIGDILTLVGGGNDATIQVDTITAAGTGVTAALNVQGLAIDGSGNILICGTFTSYNDSTGTTSINRIARLLATGKLDTTFNPGTGANSDVNSVAVQADGKILIGGAFTTINGVAHDRIARLNSDGSLDATFAPTIGATIGKYSIKVQTDQKIVVTSASTTQGLLRLNSDGTVDESVPIGGTCLKLQVDQKILIGSSSNFSYKSILNLGPPYRRNTDFEVDEDFAPGTGPASTAGTNGNAVLFNSARAWEQWMFRTGTDLYLDPRRGWTITFWAKKIASASLPGRGIALSQSAQDASPNCGFDFSFVPQPFDTSFSDGTYSTATETFAPTLGVWYFVRAWVDPTDRLLRVQTTPDTAGTLNGAVQVGGYTFDRVAAFTASVLALIHASSVPATQFAIDGLAIYEGALSDADAAINYGGGTPPAYAGVFNP